MEEEDFNPFSMLENTPNEIIDKISALASSIRNDWTDPRLECRNIWRLCDLLKEKLKVIEN